MERTIADHNLGAITARLAAPDEPSPASAIQGRLHGIIQRCLSLEDTLSTAIDGAVGPRPSSGVEGGQPSDPQEGFFTRTTSQIDAVESSLDRCTSMASQLQRLF